MLENSSVTWYCGNVLYMFVSAFVFDNTSKKVVYTSRMNQSVHFHVICYSVDLDSEFLEQYGNFMLNVRNVNWILNHSKQLYMFFHVFCSPVNNPTDSRRCVPDVRKNFNVSNIFFV